MVRSLKLIVAIMSVLNVIAVVGAAGWLAASGRVSVERARAAMEIFKKTIAQEQAEAEAEVQEAAAAAVEAVETGRVGKTPLPADGRLAVIDELEQIALIRSEGLTADATQLVETIGRERAALEADIRAFQREREAFLTMRREIEAQEGAEQFAKAVKMYDSLKPEEAASMLQALLDSGESLQAVAYLNAMSPRASTRVVQTLQERDPKLASDLVESLRTFGMVAESAEAPTDDPGG